MDVPINEDTVLVPAGCCVVRPQTGQHLFYNSRTDELHLVPPTGFLAYELCDGLRTVGEVADALSATLDLSRTGLADEIAAFLAKLVDRGILEIADGP